MQRRRPPPVPVPRSSLAAAAAAVLPLDSHPSDDVLVKSYLSPWVAYGAHPRDAFVHAADLYSAEPGDLTRRHRAAVAQDGERVWYFLSTLRSKSPRGRRKSRTVEGGTGWWKSEAGPKAVLDPLDGLRKVGYRQSFSFMRRDANGASVRTGWIMLEFRLHKDDDDEGGEGHRDQLEGIVLCKVYRSPRHIETAAAPVDGDEESCTAAETAPGERHHIHSATDSHESSDEPLVAVVAPGGKRKADDDEGSSATPRCHMKNADGETSGAVAAVMAPGLKKQVADSENEVYRAAMSAAPLLKEKAATDDEKVISSATTAAAFGNKERNKRAADDDEDSSVSTTALKRARTAGDEGSTPAFMRKAAVVALASEPHKLLCPQCGFHIGSLQAVAASAKSTSETGTRTRIAQAGAPQGGGRTRDSVITPPITFF